MKKLFLLFFATIGLFSCSTEEDDIIDNQPQQYQYNITISGNLVYGNDGLGNYVEVPLVVTANPDPTSVAIKLLQNSTDVGGAFNPLTKGDDGKYRQQDNRFYLDPAIAQNGVVTVEVYAIEPGTDGFRSKNVSANFTLQWPDDIGSGNNESVIFEDDDPSLHNETETGGLSVIGISNHTSDITVSVIVKNENNQVLDQFSIPVLADQDQFEVNFNYTDGPIFETDIILVASTEGVSKTYTYTTLPESTCTLNYQANYTIGDDSVELTINNNDRNSDIIVKAIKDSDQMVLNSYQYSITINETSKTINVPVEVINDELITLEITFSNHQLCIFEYDYQTANRITTISISGINPPTATATGGTIIGTYSNQNLINGECSMVTVTSLDENGNINPQAMLIDPITGNQSSTITLELCSGNGNISYDFITTGDQSPINFSYTGDFLNPIPANTVGITQAQNYTLMENNDAITIQQNQTSYIPLVSFDLTATYAGTQSSRVMFKIKTQTGNPWDNNEILALRINGVEFVLTSQNSWETHNIDSNGFYTFDIMQVLDITTNNTDFIVVEYQSTNFMIGSSTVFETKAEIEIDFLDNPLGNNFIAQSGQLNIDVD